MAVDLDPPGSWLQQPVQATCEGALAGAIGPDEGNALTLTYAHGEIADGRHITGIIEDQVFDLNHRRSSVNDAATQDGCWYGKATLPAVKVGGEFRLPYEVFLISFIHSAAITKNNKNNPDKHHAQVYANIRAVSPVCSLRQLQ